MLGWNVTTCTLGESVHQLPEWKSWWRPMQAAPLPAVLPAAGRISSHFGARRHPIWGHWKPHAGVDIAHRMMSAVRATQAGIVRSARWRGGYGLCIDIEHGFGWRSRYGHLARLAVREGEIVQAGAPIGQMGMTGLATGPHLHFELRYRGEPVDPLPLLLQSHTVLLDKR